MTTLKHCIDYNKYHLDAPLWFPSRVKIPLHYWNSLHMHMWSRMWFFLAWVVFFWRDRLY